MSRRRFVQGLGASAAAAGFGPFPATAFALGTPTGQAMLSGTEFDLSVAEMAVNFTGSPATAVAVNGGIPGPTLHWREGDTVSLRLTNRTRDLAAIHWHGMILPASMDGVPGISFPGIAPGESFTYRFRVGQSGTFWYHSHAGFHEQRGVYGPIVIEPRHGPDRRVDRDYVVMLSDWTDEDPMGVFAKLKRQSDYYNFQQRTAGDFLRDVERQGFGATLDDRLAWGAMNMSPTDIADVTGHTYTYLANGRPPANPWTGLFRAGEKIRLRFINGAAMTYFDVRIPGLKMTVVAADGNDIEPVTVDEFRIAVAETYDVLVEPADDRAYAVFAQSMDRSGFAAATLAPRAGMHAEIPALDPRPLLTMADMGGMAGMDMSGGMEMSKGMARAKAPGAMRHAPNAPPAGHGTMPGMAMAGHAMPPPTPGHGGHDSGGTMAGMTGMGGMGDHASPQQGGMVEIEHPASENNPGTTMRPTSVSTGLSDPGPGLRDNGRRVLTYADLRAIRPVPDRRAPSRQIDLHLTGNMERYMWSFDGTKFSDAPPLRLRFGERVKIRLVNDTMMAHPIHLHGMWSELDNGQEEFRPLKHTVNVNPGQAVSYFVNADAPGGWAYHCHLAFHMEAGMFRKVVVV